MTTPPPQGQNPYAQAPTDPTVQQSGLPGVPAQGTPGPYAPVPDQGAPLPPPAPQNKAGKKVARVLGFIVVAVVIGVVKWGIGWWATSTDAETTSVGACLHNEGNESSPDLNEVDCSSSDAQFKVVEKFDGTSDDKKCESVTKDWTISYIQSGGGHDVVLCLAETKK
ncbi:hypothetical protein [Streptomyces sp. NPDC006334]|uniref:LppU/SCO3897 family protein n=1 Tax=Streptomyces sp. NPDC006334 TaxID=3156754 RepID=UPI0033B5C227